MSLAVFITSNHARRNPAAGLYPPSMRAWILNETNGPSSYQLTDVETPTPGPNEVRVRLEASALNHLDLWTSMGLPAPKQFPHISGADGSGVIDAVGSEVDAPAVGDDVIVNPGLGYAPTTSHIPFNGKLGVLGEHAWGTLAEQVVVPATNVVPKPDWLDWHRAAAYGLVTATAYRMLCRARLAEGEMLLVVGIGGGVSSAGLLIGKLMGAEAYATSRSKAKRAWALAHGAAGAFDSAGEFASELRESTGRQADVVLENVGPATWNQSMRSLTPGGRLVTCGSSSGPKVEITVPALFFKHHEIIGSTMFDHDDFAHVSQWVANRELPVVIDEVFAFEDLPKGLARLEAGDQLGKIIIEAASA